MYKSYRVADAGKIKSRLKKLFVFQVYQTKLEGL